MRQFIQSINPHAVIQKDPLKWGYTEYQILKKQQINDSKAKPQTLDIAKIIKNGRPLKTHYDCLFCNMFSGTLYKLENHMTEKHMRNKKGFWLNGYCKTYRCRVKDCQFDPEDSRYHMKKHVVDCNTHTLEAKLNAGYEMWLVKGMTEIQQERIYEWLVKKHYAEVN